MEYYLLEYVGCVMLFIYVVLYIESLGGVKIYLKWEDLNYIGVYKINNVLG